MRKRRKSRANSIRFISVNVETLEPRNCMASDLNGSQTDFHENAADLGSSIVVGETVNSHSHSRYSKPLISKPLIAEEELEPSETNEPITIKVNEIEVGSSTDCDFLSVDNIAMNGACYPASGPDGLTNRTDSSLELGFENWYDPVTIPSPPPAEDDLFNSQPSRAQGQQPSPSRPSEGSFDRPKTTPRPQLVNVDSMGLPQPSFTPSPTSTPTSTPPSTFSAAPSDRTPPRSTQASAPLVSSNAATTNEVRSSSAFRDISKLLSHASSAQTPPMHSTIPSTITAPLFSAEKSVSPPSESRARPMIVEIVPLANAGSNKNSVSRGAALDRIKRPPERMEGSVSSQSLPPAQSPKTQIRSRWKAAQQAAKQAAQQAAQQAASVETTNKRKHAERDSALLLEMQYPNVQNPDVQSMELQARPTAEVLKVALLKSLESDEPTTEQSWIAPWIEPWIAWAGLASICLSQLPFVNSEERFRWGQRR